MAAYDVIIVGGGLVGAALASALGGDGFRVAIVEAAPPPGAAADGGFDLRVSALTRASERILGRLGVWDKLPPAGVTPFREMRVWDAAGNGSIHFDSADIGEPALGFIVENRRLQAALEARVAELGAVTWLRPATPDRVVADAAGVTLEVAGERLRARLVVGADGSNSRIREMAGIGVASNDYGHEAVVATVELERPHRLTAWQRFLGPGPIALLPLPERFGAIVWSTAPPQAAALLAESDEAFGAALERAFDSRFGAMVPVGGRRAFPLRGIRARAYVRERIALAGDAAHTVHPLAGQGVNLGFLDAACLAAVVARARDRGRDPGSFAVLRGYERWRKGDNVLVQKTLEGFKWLFETAAAPVRFSRNLGLSATDRSGPIKRAIMRRAAGLTGDLPPLARAGGEHSSAPPGPPPPGDIPSATSC